MRTGTSISGALHAGAILLLIFGGHLFPEPESVPLVMADVEVIDAAQFDAALSTEPVRPTDDRTDLKTPDTKSAARVQADDADVAVDAPPTPRLTSRTEVPAGAAERPQITPPPRVNVVPSEAPRMTIAEVPIPDELALEQAREPESRPATEQVSALSSRAEAPVAPKPTAPRVVERDPEPAEERPSEAPAPDAEPTEAAEPEAPRTAPRETPEAELAETAQQPDAPEDRAPREARLPVARPAEVARAAPATGAPETPAPERQAEPEPEKPAEPETRTAEAPAEERSAPERDEPRTASSSSSRFASQFSRGEKDALSLAIGQYFTYTGNRADRSLSVTLKIRLSEAGQIVDGPDMLRASGGDQGTQQALYQAGRRALLRAMNAGEFAKLPPAKYDAWQLIHVTFTPEEVGFST